MKFKHKLYVTALSICISIIIYYGYIDNKFRVLINDRFYRSAQLSETKLQTVISNYGIRSIINLRGVQGDESWYQTEKQIAEKNSVTLISLPFPSHELPKYLRLNQLVNDIKGAEKPVLIHCWRGADRSGLAGALVLAIEKNSPLSILKKQFSWRYGVFPLRNSIGKLVFSRYGQWLKESKKNHSSEHLLYWIKHVYTDPDSNLEYWIESVDGKQFESSFLSEDLTVTIPHHESSIIFSGWAFDAKRGDFPSEFYLKIGDAVSGKAMFLNQRPDVIAFLELGESRDRSLNVGWIAELNAAVLSEKCHDISLLFFRPPHQRVSIHTRNTLCVK